MRSSSLPLFLGVLWPGVLAPDKILSMDQIEMFKNVINKMRLQILYLIYIYIYIYISRVWHKMTNNGWYAIKPNYIKSETGNDALGLLDHLPPTVCALSRESFPTGSNCLPQLTRVNCLVPQKGNAKRIKYFRVPHCKVTFYQIWLSGESDKSFISDRTRNTFHFFHFR